MTFKNDCLNDVNLVNCLISVSVKAQRIDDLKVVDLANVIYSTRDPAAPEISKETARDPVLEDSSLFVSIKRSREKILELFLLTVIRFVK